jgi:hypothetical protein
MGAARVVLTDGGSESLLKLAKDNAARNKAPGGAIDPSCDIHVAGYRWGGGKMPATIVDVAPFDLVIGSDCTYSVGGHGPLCDTIRELLTNNADENTKVVLGHQHRCGAAMLAGRGSAGWGRDPHLDMFFRTAEARGALGDGGTLREPRVARTPQRQRAHRGARAGAHETRHGRG